jgi:hypothetical protein
MTETHIDARAAGLSAQPMCTTLTFCVYMTHTCTYIDVILHPA